MVPDFRGRSPPTKVVLEGREIAVESQVKMENAKNKDAQTKVDSSVPSSKSAGSGGGSKLKRAFSLSRNPFQSVVSGGRKAAEKSGTMTNASGVATSEQNSINSGGGGGNGHEPKLQGSSGGTTTERKIFRRLSVKKFINRIAQQMTYVNLAVSYFLVSKSVLNACSFELGKATTLTQLALKIVREFRKVVTRLKSECITPPKRVTRAETKNLNTFSQK